MRARRRAKCRSRGFTLLELLVVVLIIGTVTALAVPQAMIAVRGYRLHGSASALAGQISVTRFRATSQFTPYRLNILAAARSFQLQRMTTAYAVPTGGDPQESLTQILSRGVSYVATNPGTPQRPGTITNDAGTTAFYFNTRGVPVTATGAPVTNGGYAVYLQNEDDLYDAVTITIGGRITIWSWQPGSPGAWVRR